MTRAKTQIFKKDISIKIILICWLVYTISYFGKVNYSANISRIMDFYGVSKAQAGLAPTFFFFAYGIGQVVNGLLCKKYNIKKIIFASLGISGFINLIIAFGVDFSIIKWLWMVNGFVLSILWPTLVRFLTEVLPKKDMGKSSVVMGTTVACGTLFIYGASSLFAFIGDFRLAFYLAAVSEFIIGFIWLFSYSKMAEKVKNKDEETCEHKEDVASEKPLEKAQGKNKNFYITVYVLCFCAVGVNLIKDGLTTWVPTILKEEFSITDSLSILLSVFLPIVAVFGNMYALKMHNKIPDYVTQCAVVFGMIFAFVGFIIGSLAFKQIIFTLAGLIIVNFLASSLNSLITSIFPMLVNEKINSGLYAGVLNGFCYLGSTISSYGLGSIADGFGWNAVFFILMGFCLAVCLVWCGYACLKKNHIK